LKVNIFFFNHDMYKLYYFTTSFFLCWHAFMCLIYLYLLALNIQCIMEYSNIKFQLDFIKYILSYCYTTKLKKKKSELFFSKVQKNQLHPSNCNSYIFGPCWSFLCFDLKLYFFHVLIVEFDIWERKCSNNYIFFLKKVNLCVNGFA